MRNMIQLIHQFFSAVVVLFRSRRLVATTDFWLGQSKIPKNSHVWTLLDGTTLWHLGFLDPASVWTATKEGLLIDPGHPIARKGKAAFPNFPIIRGTYELELAAERHAHLGKVRLIEHPQPTQAEIENFDKECAEAFPPPTGS